jgi:lipoyl(octanoyl) transferase
MNPCSAPRSWRIVIDGAGDAAWNMAVDEALLDGVMANSSPPTVRLYRWRRPSVTIGRFQNVMRTIDREACTAQGIPIVRRLTGGRGILHGTDLTVSIACAVADLGMDCKRPSTLEIYGYTAYWFIAALAALGIAAGVGEADAVRGQDRIGNCFDIVSRADIVEIGTNQKVLGSALYRRGDYMLQQISIPVAQKLSGGSMAGTSVFRGRERTSEHEHHGDGTTIQADPDRLQDSIIMAVRRAYKDISTSMCVDECEQAAAQRLVASRYSQADWNSDRLER